MKRICMVICVLSVLGFVACVGPMGARGLSGPKGHTGQKGLKGHNGRSDVDLLKANYLNLVRVYNTNYETFKSRKADFDKIIPFSSAEFNNEFVTEKQRNYVYAGLGYRVSDIEIVKQIITGFMNIVSDANKRYVNDLLLALRDSAQYVHEVIEIMDAGNDFDLAKLKREINEEDISELNAMLMEMLYRRASVLDDIENMLDSTKLFLVNLSILHHIASVKSKLDPIVLFDGKIHKKIYVGDESLKNLRDAIEKKVNNIKQILLP